MGEGYRKGFAAFKAAGADPVAGDAVVAGVDRVPAQLLDRAAQKIAADSARIAAVAAVDAQRATVVSAVIAALVFALGLAGGVVFSRTVTRPLGPAVAFAREVANGDLSTGSHARGDDEMAELLAALAGEHGRGFAVVAGEVRTLAQRSASVAREIKVLIAQSTRGGRVVAGGQRRADHRRDR